MGTTINIKDVDEGLYRRLKVYSAGAGVSIRSVIIQGIERMLETPFTPSEINPRLAEVLERKVPGKRRVVIPGAANTPEAVEEKLAERLSERAVPANCPDDTIAPACSEEPVAKPQRIYTGEKARRNGYWMYEIIVDGRKTWTFDEEE